MTRLDEIKARVAEARRTGINVYRHKDVKWLLDRCESLEKRLDFERDPAGARLRQGHHPRCNQVVSPRALESCSCAAVVAQAQYLLDLHTAGKCTVEIGSVSTDATQMHPWLPPGRHYCESPLTDPIGRDRHRECKHCNSSRYPDVDQQWRQFEESAIAATTAHLRKEASDD